MPLFPHLRNLARNAGAHMLSLVLPPTCIACSEPLANTEPVGVCATCFPTLPRWDTTQHPTPPLPKYVDSFQAPFVYEDVVQGWVSRLKFYDQTQLAQPLAELMAPCVPKVARPLFVPVPLHPKRLRKRLYNQSALLAQKLAQRTGAETAMMGLIRTRYTAPQVGKTAKQRRALPLATFAAKPPHVRGRNVILIDDLWTTGSTCNACAHALKHAGAKRVDVVTLAFTAL